MILLDKLKGDRVISTGIRQNQGSSDSAASGDSSVAKDGDKEFESELLNKNKMQLLEYMMR